VHVTHRPLEHTPAVPHAVPFAASPVCTHVDCPVVHDIDPVRQLLPFGLQGAPALHAPHVPFKHTSLFPHGLPFAALPMGVQTDEPLAQDEIPVWHTLPAGLQATPCAHATHCPLSQT
jgi:hypothetical protein